MLQRFLGIHPSEKRKLLLFSLLGFAWSIASSSGIALSDAFFLKYVGSEALAITFAYTAIGMFCMSGILIYLYNRFDIDQIFFRALIIGILFYTGILGLALLGVTASPLWIVFKMFGYFFHIAFLSLFFTFLDQFFELQNAKRVFSLLYSPIFLGMAVSGGILSLSVSSLGLFGILLLIITVLIASLFLLKYISLSIEKITDDHQEFMVIKTSKKELFKAIITSKFTILFLLGALVLHSVLVITEYQYMSGLEVAFSNRDPEELTCFLGRLYCWGSLVNIFFGVFLYGRLVKKVGLNNIILIVPLFFLTLFSGWLFSSHIFLPMMGFVAVEGVLNLLEDSNFNLLLNAVPLKLKNKIRITCESILEPLGLLISSVLLFLFQAHSRILGFSLSVLFLVITCLIRAYYTKGIFYNLISHLIPFQRKDPAFKSKLSKKEYRKSRALFLNQFYDMKEGEQLFLLNSALRFNDLNFLDMLVKKITKLSKEIKLKTWDLLEDYPSGITLRLLPCFEFWTKQVPSLQNDFFFHLSKMKLLDVQVALEHLHHNCSKIQGASLLAIRQRLPRSFESKQARKILYTLLVSKNEQDNLIAIQILRYERLKDFKSKVFDLLGTASFNLKVQILKTLPYLLEKHDTQYTAILLQYLEDDHYLTLRLLIIEALEKIADVFLIKELLIRSQHFTQQENRLLHLLIKKMGSKAIPELKSIFQNIHLPDCIRLMAAKILGTISPRQLKHDFNKIAQDEIKRAYFYLYHFETVTEGLSDQNLILLKTTLKNSFDSVLGFIIQTLALINQFEEGEHLLKSLNSPHPKTYSHALETLDKMSSHKLFRQLKRIIEKENISQFLQLYCKLGLPILTLDNLLDRLEQTPSYSNQMMVSHLKETCLVANKTKSSALTKKLVHFTSELLEISRS